MAATGYLGVRSPCAAAVAPNADPMAGTNLEDLVEVLLMSNHEMVAAARQWEENATQEKRNLEVEICGLRARCTEHEAIIGENEQSLRKQLSESARSVKGLTQALNEEESAGTQENEQLRLELEQLQRERDEATLRARMANKASRAQAKEVASLRKELAVERDRKGMSLQDARELNEQL